jgi:hypothetical protein
LYVRAVHDLDLPQVREDLTRLSEQQLPATWRIFFRDGSEDTFIGILYRHDDRRLAHGRNNAVGNQLKSIECCDPQHERRPDGKAISVIAGSGAIRMDAVGQMSAWFCRLLSRPAMMAGAQSPAIQARPQLKYPILVNAPATIIMKIGIDATARSSMFAIFNLMTRSAPHFFGLGPH